MAAVKFDEIERGISETREVMQEVDARQTSIQERLSKILGDKNLQDVDIDVSDDDFEAVAANEAIMQENIASLIYGLDEITQTFGSEFKSMSE